jgi:hypothetical protein
MSGESTTTSMNDIVYSAWIEASFLDYAYDWVVAQQFFRRFSLIGKPSASLDVPVFDSNMGTVGDGGSGVDTEFNGTEGSDLSNTQATTSKVTVSVSEYALMRTLTDHLGEDSIPGIDLMQTVLADAARILMTAVEDDSVGKFSGLSQSVGSTGVDLTVAQTLAAHVGIRKRGYRAPDGVVYVLDEQQVDDLEAALIGASSATATYALGCDRLLGVDRTANNGMGNGHVMNFRGYPVYSSGLTDTANTGADVVGACFVPSSEANNPHATFGIVDKRPFRMREQRDESLRGTELVFSMRVGVGELRDGSGTAIITDA